MVWLRAPSASPTVGRPNIWASRVRLLPLRWGPTLFQPTCTGALSRAASLSSLDNRHSSTDTKLLVTCWGILMLPPPGVRAVVRDPPADQRQCDSIAPTFG